MTDDRELSRRSFLSRGLHVAGAMASAPFWPNLTGGFAADLSATRPTLWEIPTQEEIDENYKQNVKCPGWRGLELPPPGPDMVYQGRQKELFDSLVAMARQAEDNRQQVIRQIDTEAQLLRRGEMARGVLRQVMGLSKWPEKTPLNAKTHPGFERDGFKVEHVIFESRPGFFVTANLYIPTNIKPPWPAVLYVLGHTTDGKAGYQRVPANLAIKGFAVLAADPPGQGERDEYVDISTGTRTVPQACSAHARAGDPMYLTGSSFGAFRIWDSMRCIDYLQSRPDVIGSRIGVTGRSGGGWESIWLGAIDTRVTAINTNCYTTTFLRRIENRAADIEPDPEQDPFGLLSAGLDIEDLYIACYPRPVSLGVTIRDFFPIDGALKCFTEVRSLYAIAKKEDHLGITVVDAPHEDTKELQRQTYRWMLKWLKDDPKPDESESLTFKNEFPKLIDCTPTGIVLTSLGGKTSAQFNGELARDLAINRRAKQSQPDWLSSIPHRLRELLRMPMDRPAVPVTFLEEQQIGSVTVTPMRIVLPEKLTLMGHLWKPQGHDKGSAVIWISPKIKNYDPLANEVCKSLAAQGKIVLDFDPRGMGPLEESYEASTPLVESSLTYHSFLLGRPILGMRVTDVLRAADVLAHQMNIEPHLITLHGQDYGALLALFAGCLDPRVGGIVEENGLTSYNSICWNRSYGWPVNSMLPDVLKEMDLEDIRAALAPRHLTVLTPLDHLKLPLSTADANEQYSMVTRAFMDAGLPDAFTIKT